MVSFKKAGITSALGVVGLLGILAFAGRNATLAESGEGSFGGEDIDEIGAGGGFDGGAFLPSEIPIFTDSDPLTFDQNLLQNVDSNADTSQILNADSGGTQTAAAFTALGVDVGGGLLARKLAREAIAQDPSLVTNRKFLTDPSGVFKQGGVQSVEQLTKAGVRTSTKLTRKLGIAALPGFAGIGAESAFGAISNPDDISNIEGARQGAIAGGVGEVAQIGTTAAFALVGTAIAPGVGTVVGGVLGFIVGTLADVAASEATLKFGFDREDTLFGGDAVDFEALGESAIDQGDSSIDDGTNQTSLFSATAANLEIESIPDTGSQTNFLGRARSTRVTKMIAAKEAAAKQSLAQRSQRESFIGGGRGRVFRRGGSIVGVEDEGAKQSRLPTRSESRLNRPIRGGQLFTPANKQ